MKGPVCTACNPPHSMREDAENRMRKISDARLIAAAPRMLGVLRAIDSLVVPTKLIDPTSVQQILTEARAILRDVEGESNG